MSAENFSYMRLPHVSHGVFAAGPIGGTFAIPSNPTDKLAAHLNAQRHAQSLMYGSAPSSAAFVPPPLSWSIDGPWFVACARNPSWPLHTCRPIGCLDLLGFYRIILFQLGHCPITLMVHLRPTTWPNSAPSVFKRNVGHGRF